MSQPDLPSTDPLPVDDPIKRHYPNAVTQSVFREKLNERLAVDHRLDPAKILLANSFCADDVIALRESDVPSGKAKLKREFLGPFSMGGLAGIPYSGLTGMSAVAHHIPDGGSLVIAYGPHIGVSEQGELGKLLRPGQHRESAACGALTLAVEHLRSSPDYRPRHDDDDIEQMALERLLLPCREQILKADDALKAATDFVYDIIHQLIDRYVRARKTEFRCDTIVLVGGVIINTSPGHEDYYDVRHFSLRRVAEL